MFEYFRDKVSNNNGVLFWKCILPKMRLTNGGMIFKYRYFFSWNYELLRCNDRLSWKQKIYKYSKIRTDNNDRIIVLEAEIDDEIFLLINLYNPNTEVEQVKTLCELEQMLDIFSWDSYKKIFLLETLIAFLTQIYRGFWW